MSILCKTFIGAFIGMHFSYHMPEKYHNSLKKNIVLPMKNELNKPQIDYESLWKTFYEGCKKMF